MVVLQVNKQRNKQDFKLATKQKWLFEEWVLRKSKKNVISLEESTFECTVHKGKKAFLTPKTKWNGVISLHMCNKQTYVCISVNSQ